MFTLTIDFNRKPCNLKLSKPEIIQSVDQLTEVQCIM